MRKCLDVNCDMGESFGNWTMGDDAGIRRWITTANLACGFHAGDAVTMIKAVDEALGAGIAVGAHPGLPDLLGFGRRMMDISPEDAYAYVLYQAGALSAILRSRGAALHHVKPHGAFHYLMNDSEPLSEAVLEAVEQLMGEPLVYWPAGREDGALVRAARRRGIRITFEFYPDLAYRSDGALVIERQKAGVDSSNAVTRLRRLLETGTVETVDGPELTLEVESICIHGDSPSASQNAQAVVALIDELGYSVEAVA